MPARRPSASGQAALELMAVVPLVLAAALLAWQAVAVIRAGAAAQESVRARALTAAGPRGSTVAVAARRTAPALLPGLDGLSLGARAAVRAP